LRRPFPVHDVRWLPRRLDDGGLHQANLFASGITVAGRLRHPVRSDDDIRARLNLAADYDP